jgi:catechol 2,3-dioxygenase-like lactoylglutathione lyase family enzyme
MPAITHIAETVLYTDNLDRALNFYTGLFGCPVLRRDERLCALRIAEGQVLLLFTRGGSIKPALLEGGVVPAHDGAGPLHVCFGIPFGEVSQWEQRLRELGIALESRVRWPGGATSLYFRDPDQHAVELATPGLWEK